MLREYFNLLMIFFSCFLFSFDIEKSFVLKQFSLLAN
jgi:hypothetical protein